MNTVRSRGPIVIDIDVFRADLVAGSRLAEDHAPLITGRLAFISFQTALSYGAVGRGWGQPRMLRMEAKIARVEVVHSAGTRAWLRRGGDARPGKQKVLLCRTFRTLS